MNRVVWLDSTVWIALRDRREPWHTAARALVADLLRERTVLAFSPLILAETHAYFSRSPLLREQILNDAERNPAMVCEPVTPADQRAATALLRERPDKRWSLCDALSFVVMRRLEIRRAASFDDHFRRPGDFEVLP